MDQLPKFKPLAGRTYVLRFCYDKPLTGESEYGKYWQYTFDVWETSKDYINKKVPQKMVWFTKEHIHLAIEAMELGQHAVFGMDVGQEAKERNGKSYTYTTLTFKFTRNDEKIEINSEDYRGMKAPETSAPPKRESRSFDDIADTLAACFAKVNKMCDEWGDMFMGRDRAALTSSLFIEVNKSGVVPDLEPPEAEAPPPSDDDQPPLVDEDDSLPF